MPQQGSTLVKFHGDTVPPVDGSPRTADDRIYFKGILKNVSAMNHPLQHIQSLRSGDIGVSVHHVVGIDSQQRRVVIDMRHSEQHGPHDWGQDAVVLSFAAFDMHTFSDAKLCESVCDVYYLDCLQDLVDEAGEGVLATASDAELRALFALIRSIACTKVQLRCPLSNVLFFQVKHTF